ncbi:DedA family protein [Sphingoaurantiacus capsulatus]|uniref:DedA family protein n=1 Tax=Sphingoaurantiacus capsulatus TaxID=1771310 RepID=A0ABV7XBU5_9SPHN
MDSWLTDLIEQSGYLGVAFLMFLETVFPPIPSEVIMSLAGFEASTGSLSLSGVIAAGTAGAMLGNTFWYLVARAFGYARFKKLTEKHGRILTIHPEELDSAQHWFDRWGGFAVGIGRIIPTARSLISVPAGILKMSLSRFFIYSLIGTATWTALLAFAGYALGRAYADAEKYINPFATGVMLLIVLLYVYRFVTYDKRDAK